MKINRKIQIINLRLFLKITILINKSVFLIYMVCLSNESDKVNVRLVFYAKYPLVVSVDVSVWEAIIINYLMTDQYSITIIMEV